MRNTWWVSLFLLLLLWLSLQSCSPEVCWHDQLSLSTINTQGTSCNRDCECNNLLFVGRCENRKCNVGLRERCENTSAEARRPCALPGKKGECAQGTQFCQPEPFTQKLWGNCIPRLASQEVCNGKDDDCDGTTDEDLNCCVPNQTRACYTGLASTKGQGTCLSGTQICNNKRRWGPCENQTFPVAEKCDEKDNDCNGKIDDVSPTPCYDFRVGCQREQQGFRCTLPCQAGTLVCKGDQSVVCVSQMGPKPEVCNGKDDNCNGEIDESLQETCYTGPKGTQDIGLCLAGIRLCQQGQWGLCEQQTTPRKESCDGRDNDCDGIIDEDLQRLCQTVCEQGVETCHQGTWQRCTAQSPPCR